MSFVQWIVTAVLNIISSVVSIWKSKSEMKEEEFRVKNTEETIKRAEIVLDVKEKDEYEALVKRIKEAPTDVEKQIALDKLRKLVSS